MRSIRTVLGLVAVVKGVFLVVDPDRLILFGRQFRALFPLEVQRVLDRETDRVLDYARGKPGGLNTLGLLTVVSGFLLLRGGSPSR